MAETQDGSASGTGALASIGEGGAAGGDRFVWREWVHFDELDPMGMLHNARYAFHVERATSALFGARGWRWQVDPRRNPDQFHVVQGFQIEFLAPFRGIGELEVELWVERMGGTSCTYAFRCTGDGGQVLHARGRRTIVKVDLASLRPAPWSEEFRQGHASLVLPVEAA